MNVDALSNSHKLRATVLTRLSLLLALVSVTFAVYNYHVFENYTLTICHAIFAIYSYYIYNLSKQFLHSQRSIQTFTFTLAVLVCIANYQLPIENGTFIWGCTFPIFYYLLLGKKCGLINSTVFFAIHLFITISKIGFSPDQISNMLVLNMAVCYLLVWFTSHIFESNREKSELNLSVLAAKDALTNTYNRLALNHQFPLLQKHDNAPLSLLILDIDFFKQINDQFGHSVGDKVLIETAIVLKKIIGESQVFRIGGEEFCITLPHTDLNQAENFAEALRQSIADHHYKTVDHPIQLTVSIGVCECSSDIELDDVLVKADIELYRAKKNGRNQVMVCSEQKQYEVLSEQSPISSATR